jgi:hypothetical protein
MIYFDTNADPISGDLKLLLNSEFPAGWVNVSIG